MANLALTLPVLVVLAFLVIAIVALVSVANAQRQRSDMLRERFGPEYQRTVEQVGDRRKAEAELAARTKRVQEFDIHPLAPRERDQFLREWQATQARFVDDPQGAVTEADHLVVQAMQARGYPMESFDQRVADISVNHPDVVQNYRAARDIALRNEQGQATTEDLRQAMVYYRDLFNDLLETTDMEKTSEESK